VNKLQSGSARLWADWGGESLGDERLRQGRLLWAGVSHRVASKNARVSVETEMVEPMIDLPIWLKTVMVLGGTGLLVRKDKRGRLCMMSVYGGHRCSMMVTRRVNNIAHVRGVGTAGVWEGTAGIWEGRLEEEPGPFPKVLGDPFLEGGGIAL